LLNQQHLYRHGSKIFMHKHKFHTEETSLLPLRIENKGIVYKDDFKKIEKIHARFKDFTKEYLVSDFGLKAAVIVVKEGNVLLARQYRILINGLSYEIPAGRVSKNESPKEAAIRECLEETGFKCGGLKPLISYNPDLEYTRNHTYVFYTNNAKDIESDKFQCVWVRLGDCMKMIQNGKISDCMSILSILAYERKIKGK